jgi:hypothetical protein
VKSGLRSGFVSSPFLLQQRSKKIGHRVNQLQSCLDPSSKVCRNEDVKLKGRNRLQGSVEADDETSRSTGAQLINNASSISPRTKYHQAHSPFEYREEAVSDRPKIINTKVTMQ